MNIICIINKITKLIQIIFKPSISNNNVCNGLLDESSRNLFILESIWLFVFLMWILSLLIVVIIEWANPAVTASATMILAFCIGCKEDFTIPLDIADST